MQINTKEILTKLITFFNLNMLNDKKYSNIYLSTTLYERFSIGLSKLFNYNSVLIMQFALFND